MQRLWRGLFFPFHMATSLTMEQQVDQLFDAGVRFASRHSGAGAKDKADGLDADFISNAICPMGRALGHRERYFRCLANALYEYDGIIQHFT